MILGEAAQGTHVIFVELVPGKSFNGVPWSTGPPELWSAQGIAKSIRRSVGYGILQQLRVVVKPGSGEVFAGVNLAVPGSPEEFFKHDLADGLPKMIRKVFEFVRPAEHDYPTTG